MVKPARISKKQVKQFDNPIQAMKQAIAELEKICIKHYGLDYNQLLVDCRDQQMVMIRHCWAYLLNTHYGFTHEMVAEILKRERSGITHNIQTAHALQQHRRFEPFNEIYDTIYSELKSAKCAK